ncbi:MAG: ROK family protein [Chloroflexota bacterium]
MKNFIAIDIGGTQIRAASYAENATVPLKVERISTQGAKETPIERLVMAIRKVWPEEGRVAAIAAAAPGPVDPYQGVVIQAPNIPGWVNLPLGPHLQETFGVPVALGNDANLAAMGEWKFGAGQGHHHLIYITVSTGIGAGVILDDRLVLGVRGLAAELGHIVVLPDGPLCGCGHRGHLEALASGPSIARWAKEQIEAGKASALPADRPFSAKEVAMAAKEGDALAVAALARAGQFLGWAIADFLHIFNPSIVVIGGGVSQSGPLLFEPLHSALQERILDPEYSDQLAIVPAALGDDVGLMGALALAVTTTG